MNSQQIKNAVVNQYQLNPITTYVGIVNGNKSNALNNFMKEVSLAFDFPDYYSGNINSFTEIMNDLSWLNAKDYVLAVTESDKFLQNESLKEQEEIKNILENISKEWSNVPNYQGEDEYRKQARFIVHYM